jgi:hypothetical protein
MVWRYRFCGLVVDSDLELPTGLASDCKTSDADVVISSGEVPMLLEDPEIGGYNWQVSANRSLLRIHGIARFLVTGGRRIVYTPEDGASTRQATPYLSGSAFGMVLRQRGMSVLHAATVKVGDRAVALCGPSGAGKSTLAATLERNGYQHITDDLCVIDIEDNCAVVRPDGQYLRLSDQAIERLRIEDRRGHPLPGAKGKFCIAPSGEASCDPIPLAAIYELVETSEKVRLGITSLNPTSGAAMLYRNRYRPNPLPKVEQRAGHFFYSARIMQNTSLFQLARDWDIDTLDRTVNQLERHWKKLGLSVRSVGGEGDQQSTAEQ